jgi:hypothetical protein
MIMILILPLIIFYFFAEGTTSLWAMNLDQVKVEAEEDEGAVLLSGKDETGGVSLSRQARETAALESFVKMWEGKGKKDKEEDEDDGLLSKIRSRRSPRKNCKKNGGGQNLEESRSWGNRHGKGKDLAAQCAKFPICPKVCADAGHCQTAESRGQVPDYWCPDPPGRCCCTPDIDEICCSYKVGENPKGTPGQRQ